MKLENARRIVKAGEEAGLDLDLREEYSGRSMYGRTTAGIVGNLADILKAVALAAGDISGDTDTELEAFAEDMGDCTTDSMGRQIILY